MENAKIGNLIRSPHGRKGILIIISESRCHTNKDEKYYNAQPIDSNNCFIGISEKTHPETKQCFCYEGNGGDYDDDCEDCNGTGAYTEDREGMDRYDFVANNIKEYIMAAITKNFNF